MKETKPKYQEKLVEMEKAIDDGYKGLITKIEEKTNVEYFKVQSSYGEKKGIVLHVKVNSPDGEEFTNWMSVPDKIRGIEKSNIYAFKQKYGNYPDVGIEVDCLIDENGFFKVVF